MMNKEHKEKMAETGKNVASALVGACSSSLVATILRPTVLAAGGPIAKVIAAIGSFGLQMVAGNIVEAHTRVTITTARETVKKIISEEPENEESPEK